MKRVYEIGSDWYDTIAVVTPSSRKWDSAARKIKGVKGWSEPGRHQWVFQFQNKDKERQKDPDQIGLLTEEQRVNQVYDSIRVVFPKMFVPESGWKKLSGKEINIGAISIGNVIILDDTNGHEAYIDRSFSLGERTIKCPPMRIRVLNIKNDYPGHENENLNCIQYDEVVDEKTQAFFNAEEKAKWFGLSEVLAEKYYEELNRSAFTIFEKIEIMIEQNISRKKDNK